MSKLLIVEDSLVNQQILKKMLENDYEIITASNGQEALNILKDTWHSIDLILLDIVMPIMDGYAFLDAIKAYPDYLSIPIIVTTSNDSDKDEVKALADGATDFIRKPYHWQIVKHRINNIITLRQTAAMFNLIKFDQLTGLFSKEFFYKQASEKIEKITNGQFDIIACDIENFSLVNDTFGYDAGNEVLKTVAWTLKENIPDNYLCTRLNSDIFVALVPHRDDYSDSFFSEITTTINEALYKLEIVLDYGVYHIEDNSMSIYSACNNALSVIEKVKDNFSRCYAEYDEEFKKDRQFAQRITATMENALRDKEFVVYLQPKYDLISERMIGAEALVRWISPTEGFMPPGKFIPLFEKNGFICELDKFVWEEACKFIRYSIDNSLPRLPISVNVSRLDLINLDVPAVIKELIDKYNLEPSDLHLEITETAYNEHPEIILGVTDILHDKGHILELDDFGTGYSSLNLLSEMSLDILKLDMRFAQNHTTNHKQNEILSFILDLARRMNLVVISEGVETEEQANNLRDMGCDQAQGYFFARPVTMDEYEKMLRRQGESL